MPHQKQFPNNPPESIEENTAGDSTLNEKAADKVRLHVRTLAKVFCGIVKNLAICN